LLSLNTYDGALENINRALSYNPREREYLYVRAQIEVELKMNAAARRDLEASNASPQGATSGVEDEVRSLLTNLREGKSPGKQFDDCKA
jgi:hypothetical protein